MVDATDVSVITEDGETLQAELALPSTPTLGIVVTHPHPLMGGDMHTPVPAAFFRAGQSRGAAVLRFNFRGVGRSTGTHDKGGAERLDVAAALSHLAAAAPGVPIVLAGWSFGADVSLAIEDDRVVGWFLAAPPLSVIDPAEMAAAQSRAPKVLAIGETDQFNAPDQARETTADWQNTTIREIANADHFFGPQLPTLVEAFESFLDTLAS